MITNYIIELIDDKWKVVRTEEKNFAKSDYDYLDWLWTHSIPVAISDDFQGRQIFRLDPKDGQNFYHYYFFLDTIRFSKFGEDSSKIVLEPLEEVVYN